MVMVQSLIFLVYCVDIKKYKIIEKALEILDKTKVIRLFVFIFMPTKY